VTAAVPICNGSGAPKRYHQSRSRSLLVWACAFGGAFPAFMGCGRLSWSGVGRGSSANQPASGFLRARKHDDLNNAFLKARGNPHRSHESRSSATCRSISSIVRPEGGKVLRDSKSAARSLARGDTDASSVDGGAPYFFRRTAVVRRAAGAPFDQWLALFLAKVLQLPSRLIAPPHASRRGPCSRQARVRKMIVVT